MTDTAKAPAEVTTVSVTIDGKVIEANAGELIIEAAERAGVFIPRFCYHPRMEPVGMCRMCLVEVSGPRGFSLQPSCYLKVADGQEVLTNSAKAVKAQEGVLEFLLVNHPLDCPVCDKGGECPLQDQAFSYGPGESRFSEEKRHWEKPIALSPLVELDRERCIQCARCTRFADEIAGDALIDFAYRGDKVEVATFPDRPFASYFSGNTVQICPVGALTAKPYRFKSRPWDLEQVETTCTTCSVGCRVVGQSSGGQFVRYLGVDVDAVNQSWLCDKGRFAFEAVHATNRLTTPIIRRDGEASVATWHEALNEIVAALRWANERGGPEQVGIIGGSRLSNEDAFAWSKLAKAVIKTDSIDAQLGDGLPASTVLGLPRATIDEAASAPLIVSLAPDLREELPVLFLRLRKSLEKGTTKLIECSSIPTSLTSLATQHLSYLPGEAARLASSLSGGTTSELTGVNENALAAAKQLISDHKGDVVFIVGRTAISESAESIAAAASVFHQAFPEAKFLSALRRANVHGALDMGLAPGILPGRVSLEEGRSQLANSWGELCEAGGLDTTAMLKAAVAGELTTLILLGADPLADFPDRRLAEEALRTVPFSVSIGTHPDASSDLSHVVLPVVGDAERSGSTTNLEGRVTRLAPKVVQPGISWPAWMVAVELANRLGGDLGFDSIESIQDEIAAVAPAYRSVNSTILGRGDLRDGVLVPVQETSVSIGVKSVNLARFDPIATPGISSVVTQGAPMTVGATTPLDVPSPMSNGSTPSGIAALSAPSELPSATRLDSYSMRLVARRSLYDNGTLTMNSTSLRELVAKPVARVHPNELARFGVANGDQLLLRSAHGELKFEALADETVPRNVVVVATNIAAPDSAAVNALISIDDHGTDIRLETV